MKIKVRSDNLPKIVLQLIYRRNLGDKDDKNENSSFTNHIYIISELKFKNSTFKS